MTLTVAGALTAPQRYVLTPILHNRETTILCSLSSALFQSVCCNLATELHLLLSELVLHVMQLGDKLMNLQVFRHSL